MTNQDWCNDVEEILENNLELILEHEAASLRNIVAWHNSVEEKEKGGDTVEQEIIKDSGERRQFPTGAQRDRATGKGRMDLLPYRALIEVSKLFEAGAIKYEARNWEKGMPVSEFLDSGARHHAKLMIGMTDEPHIVQWCWNALCALDTVLRVKDGTLPEELLDNLDIRLMEDSQ